MKPLSLCYDIIKYSINPITYIYLTPPTPEDGPVPSSTIILYIKVRSNLTEATIKRNCQLDGNAYIFFHRSYVHYVIDI